MWSIASKNSFSAIRKTRLFKISAQSKNGKKTGADADVLYMSYMV
jgi:hypothetical protein